MIFSQNKKTKAVIFLSQEKIKYVSLSVNKKKHSIDMYDQALLRLGVIQDKEILQIEFLSKILSKIQKKLDMKSVDVLLPHDFFIHEKIVLDISYSNDRKMKKFLYTYLTKNSDNYPWILTHSFEVIFYKKEKGVEAHIQMLEQENYRALNQSFKKADLEITAIHSEDFSFSHIFSKTEKTLHMRVFKDTTRFSLFEKGVHLQDNSFDFSYITLSKIVQSYSAKNDDSGYSLEKNGFLANYDNTDIYTQLSKSMNTLLLGVKKHITKDIDVVYVSFEDYVIPGLIDVLQKNFQKKIVLINPLHFPHYFFDDFLPIHRDEISEYTSCILYLLGKNG